MFHISVRFADGRTVEGHPDSPDQIRQLIADRVAGHGDVRLVFGDWPGDYLTGEVHRIEITF